MLESKRPLNRFGSARFIGRFPKAGFGRWIFEVEDDSTLVELKLPLELFDLTRFSVGFSGAVFGR